MKAPKKDARVAKKSGRVKTSAPSTDARPATVGSRGADHLGMLGTLEERVPEREFTTSSPEETFELGRTIGSKLPGPVILLVMGDLGAGKTVFAKGVAAGLEIDPAEVTSPSFTIINVHQGRLRLYHVDLYRLDRSGSEGLGLEEIFDDPEGVTVIEWAERLPWVPERAMRVQIAYVNDSSRKILISGA